MTRSVGRPTTRVHNPVPRVPGRFRGAGESTAQAQQAEQQQLQPGNPSISPVFGAESRVFNTPQGSLLVQFNVANGQYIATGISKNIIFTKPINQSVGPLSVTGTTSYTYALQNNNLITTATSSSGVVSYNGTPIANIGKGGAVSIIPGATISQPEFAQISGSNQNLGNVILTPSYSGGQFSLNPTGFTANVVTYNGTAFATKIGGPTQQIGVTLQTTPTFNQSTGQISINFPNPQLPAGYIFTGPTYNSITVNNPSPAAVPKIPGFNTATSTAFYSGIGQIGNGVISAPYSYTAAFGFTPVSAPGKILPQIIYSSSSTVTPTTATLQLPDFTQETLSSIGIPTPTQVSQFITGFQTKNNPVFGLEKAQINLVYGTVYDIAAVPVSLTLTPYQTGQFIAQTNPGLTLGQKGGIIAGFAVSTLYSLSPPGQVQSIVQSIRTQGIIKTGQQTIASGLFFGGLGLIGKGIETNIKPTLQGPGVESAPLISTRAIVTEQTGSVATITNPTRVSQITDPQENVLINLKQGQVGSIEFRPSFKLTYPNGATTVEGIGISRSISASTITGSEQTALSGGSIVVKVTSTASTPLRDFFGIAPKQTVDIFRIPTAKGTVTVSGNNPLSLVINQKPVYAGELQNSVYFGEATEGGKAVFGETSVLRYVGSTSNGKEYAGLTAKFVGFQKNGEPIYEGKPFFIFENKELLSYDELANPKATIVPEKGYTGPTKSLPPSPSTAKALDVINSEPTKTQQIYPRLSLPSGSKTTTQTTFQTQKQSYVTQIPLVDFDLLTTLAKSTVKPAKQTTSVIPLITVPQTTRTQFATSNKTYTNTKIIFNSTTKSTNSFKITNTLKSNNKLLTATSSTLKQSFKPSITNKVVNTTKTTQREITSQKSITSNRTISAYANPSINKPEIIFPFISIPQGKRSTPKKQKKIPRSIINLKFKYIPDIAHIALKAYEKRRGVKVRLGKVAFSRPI